MLVISSPLLKTDVSIFSKQNYVKKRAYVRKIINYYEQLELENDINYPERSHLDSVCESTAAELVASLPIDIAVRVSQSDEEADSADEADTSK